LGYAAVRYAQKFHIPVVATYHTHFVSYAGYYNVKALESLSWTYFRNIYNKCQAVYVPSLPVLNELRENGINNLMFLPHGVDTSVFNKNFKTGDWKKNYGIENKKALLFSGRLVWEKDLQVLADAYDIIMKKRNDAIFVIAGDGPVRGELEKLMPGALFLGHQSGNALSTAYASSDILVFPSTTETFGNVTVEAMASGIPPVCARKGGAYGIIKDGITGLIAEPVNALSLADKIEILLDNPGLRNQMAQNGFEFAQTQSWDSIFKKLFDSYLDIINRFDYRSKAA
jgi:glycosyltransferase involved in cell wall biosynthesis